MNDYSPQEREELDEIDLRKVVELKGPDSTASPEQQCIISIITDDKYVSIGTMYSSLHSVYDLSFF